MKLYSDMYSKLDMPYLRDKRRILSAVCSHNIMTDSVHSRTITSKIHLFSSLSNANFVVQRTFILGQTISRAYQRNLCKMRRGIERDCLVRYCRYDFKMQKVYLLRLMPVCNG
jgi:hypothetical protein